MSEILKILILEDALDDADLIERELRKSGIKFRSQVVNTREEFQGSLSNLLPDVVLSDHALPKFNSIEALSLHNEYRRRTNTLAPFILVTGSVSEEFAVQCIKAGADDYILKSSLKRLPSAIINAIERGKADRERSQLHQKLIGKANMLMETERLASIGSWTADLVNNRYQWSDECFRILGYEPQEIKPGPELFLSFVHPDDYHRLKVSSDHIHELDSYESDIRIIDRHNVTKYIHLKLVVNRNEGKDVIGFTGFLRDISKEKETDLKLQRSEQEYKSLYDYNPDAVCSFDLHGRFTQVNEPLIRLTGLTREQLLLIDFTRFLTDRESEKVLRNFSLACAGTVQHYETECVNAKGELIMVHVTNVPIMVDGEIRGVHAIIKNITEKKALERNLEHAHKLAQLGDWELDVKQMTLGFSKIGRELLELGPEEQLGLNELIGLFKYGSHREAVISAIDSAISGGSAWDLELLQVMTGGEERWLRWIGTADIKGGECIRLFGTIQNIHKQKKAEENLKQAYAAIEDQNTKLKEIAWIQSHEVRAPLSRIMGLINLLKNEDVESLTSNEILNLINRSAHELDGLIRAIVRKSETINEYN
jgi:PAS domain S-box-containing protein